ncbi:hypothetical protein [Ornithinibacillus bavariensis]|uniref:Uncharacterized protein n=1 Tax=Ornithinibacillus bavariensis TaxID=545502 RepID=A0A920C7P3_9BACI|nr:hypothetical protein [Ornithinibacillus bavariensis]GIO27883.1 hypothetical protein J43TS3_24940 [Ornithinibacillus bavariensis]HAM80340.1 hypothetical protein [Ornithinibacillus sp.]
MEKRKSNWFWGIVISFTILLAYIVPYTILSKVHAWNGSFLYWTITGIIIIIANLFITRGWRD